MSPLDKTASEVTLGDYVGYTWCRGEFLSESLLTEPLCKTTHEIFDKMYTGKPLTTVGPY